MISNLEYYKTFFYVANLGSFSAAAKQLNLTQSAVSQAIKKLEEELDCQLFIRYPRKSILTPMGEELYPKVRDAFTLLQKGEQNITNILTQKQKEKIIGATETSIRYYLPEYIKSWSKENPHYRLTLQGTTTSELCKLLNDGLISEAFLVDPIPKDLPNNLKLNKIGEFQDIAVASSDFFKAELADKEKISIKDLACYPMISVSKENSVLEFLQKWFLSEGVILTPQYTVPHIGLVKTLIESDLGIGFIPDLYVKDDIKSGKIIRLQTTSLPQKRSVFLAHT